MNPDTVITALVSFGCGILFGALVDWLIARHERKHIQACNPEPVQQEPQETNPYDDADWWKKG